MWKKILSLLFGPEPTPGICATCGEDAAGEEYTICWDCAEQEEMDEMNREV